MTQALLSRFSLLGSVLILLLFSQVAQASPTVDEEKATAIRDLMGRVIAEDEPGYAVGVVIDDQMVFSHFSGLALLDTPTPIDEDTRFNIASVAKQFTAIMVLELVRSGQIDLAEDFRTYLPDAMPDVEQTITVTHLLTHTSGIRDIYDLFFLTNATWYESDFTNRTAMDLLERQASLNFEPGTSHRYSNSNYILLAELVAKVTGQDFDDYAKGFFEARGMAHSTVRSSSSTIVPRLARAYGNWGSEWMENPDIANTHGDGFVYTTLPDMLHWETQIWGNEATLASDIVLESQAPIEAANYPFYGFGIEFGFYRGVPITYHEGATGSYNTYTMRFPDKKLSVVTMGNTSQVNAVALARRVAEIIMPDAFDDTVGYPAGPQALGPVPSTEDYLGLYELDNAMLFSLTMSEGELYREVEWQEPVRMVYEGANVFHYETDPMMKLALHTDDDGQRRIDIYSPARAPLFGGRIEAAPEGDAYMRSLEGAFYNDETNTEIILKYKQDDEFTMVKNGRPRTLQLKGEDYLVWNAYRITVLRDETGRATGLSVDRDRIRNVAFYRTD